MKRILVIGCPGAGKSTFSKKLSNKLNIPIIYLDHLFWKPGWEQVDIKTFDATLSRELEKSTWILDGVRLKDGCLSWVNRQQVVHKN